MRTRSGDRIAIAAYLGRRDTFDRALVTFSETYADQNERDHQTLTEAVDSARLAANEPPRAQPQAPLPQLSPHSRRATPNVDDPPGQAELQRYGRALTRVHRNAATTSGAHLRRA